MKGKKNRRSSTLSPKQRKMMKGYLEGKTIAQSTLDAGYNAKNKNIANSVGSRILSYPKVQQEMQRILESKNLSLDKMAQHLSDHINTGKYEGNTAQTSLKALEIALKLSDAFPATKTQTESRNLNLTLNTPTEELTHKIDKMKNQTEDFINRLKQLEESSPK